jgi:hypothetical protein
LSGGSGGSGAGGASGRNGASARGRAAATRTPAQRRRHARRLRRSVARLSACLDQLPTRQRRVLVLRAGLGAARPHSRHGVARALDITVRRVGRLERSGLRQARELSRASACGVTDSTSSGSTAGTTLITTPGGDPAAGGGAPDPAAKGSEAPSARKPGTGDQGGVRGESDTRVTPIPPGDGPSGGIALALAIVLIVLAGLAGYVTPHLRGRLRSE